MRDTQRLDKVLGNSGYGTRKEIKQLVKTGTVKIDGAVVKESAMHVVPESSVIEVGGERLNYRKFIYLMMNKPEGIVSAAFDNKFRTVVDILPEVYKKFELFPVGRLDRDTEGLLLITNNGQLAHELLTPKKHVPKTYFALVEGAVDSSDISAFKAGVVLDDGYKTLPAELEVFRAGNYSEVELVIYEGKFHQVKRMFESRGKKVKYLKRIRMGGLKLDESLRPGECRELASMEIELLERVEDGI